MGAAKTKITSPTSEGTDEEVMPYDEKEIDLLLIGKTGNGKSATGNSILLCEPQNKTFLSKSSFESVTTEEKWEVSEYYGRIIKVVDTPGVGDTREDPVGQLNMLMSAMERAISWNVKGYHAFLLVVRFGGRFTEEDVRTIHILKGMFGDDFVKKYCILVITCGDHFETDSRETGDCFEEWCQKQGGDFEKLYNECNGRAILFDNGTRDERKKKAQLKQLLELIDGLSTNGQRYRDENFEKAAEARARILVEAKEPMIRDETMKQTTLLHHWFIKIRAMEHKQQEQPLNELLKNVEDLYESIKKEDKGTGALHELLKNVESLKKTVEYEIAFAPRLAAMQEKMEKMEKMNREKMEKMNRENQREQEQLKKEMQDQKETMTNNYNGIKAEFDKLKAKNDKGIAEKTVNAVTWPLRATARGIDWLIGSKK